MWSWCVCGGLLNGLDQDFGLCSGSLLRWHSLLSWSSQLELWALMVLGGQKWSKRLCVCDLSERALFFRCMVAWLSWHFLNFPWLCKVFLQTSLHFASQFRSLEVISQLGGHFAAILKPKGDFAAKSHFRSQGAFSQTISQPMEKIETFSQPILKLDNHFIAILKLGDHFIAIWEFENHLVAKGHFRSTWRIW